VLACGFSFSFLPLLSENSNGKTARANGLISVGGDLTLLATQVAEVNIANTRRVLSILEACVAVVFFNIKI
jgi:hypothetical protein